LAHVIGDFYLQSNKLCEQKIAQKWKSWFLYAHSAIIGILSWIVVPHADFIWLAIIIFISHLIIDAIKSCMSTNLVTFAIDQILHIAIIAIIAAVYNGSDTWLSSMPHIGYVNIVSLAIGILVCIKPTNILIKLTLEKYKVGKSNSCEEIKNAGALIGNLERILAIIFVIIGQYESIGFIVAAKSLLRFKDTDTAKTEYVLAGTFLSFGIAIICGLLIT
jgi:hypothetical protein